MSKTQESNFLSIFPEGTGFEPSLSEQIKLHKIDNLGITSSIWKFYLLFFPQFGKGTVSADEWIPFVEEKRKEYQRISEKYFIRPENTNEVDPLNQSEDSLWNQYHKDNALITTIKSDVDRYFSGEGTEHHRQPCINILFLHIRYNENVSYYQENHYIACRVYQLLFGEMNDSSNGTEAFSILFNESYAESDAFWVYNSFMKMMYPLIIPSEEINVPSLVQEKAYEIQSTMLSKYFPEIYKQLSNFNIDSRQYMTKWIKILFSTIFDDNQVNNLWSTILLFYPSPDFIYFMCISILFTLKEEILKSENEFDILNCVFHTHLDNFHKESELAFKMLSNGNNSWETKDMRESLCVEISKFRSSINDFDTEEIISRLKKIQNSIRSIISVENKFEGNIVEPLRIMKNENSIVITDEEIPLPKASSKSESPSISVLSIDDDEEPVIKLDLTKKANIEDLFN